MRICAPRSSPAAVVERHERSHEAILRIANRRFSSREQLPLYPWARWAAKWIDLSLFGIFLVIALSIGGFDWFSETADLVAFCLFLVAFPFWDAILLSLSGGSPGRATFRFRVQHTDGGNPNFDRSLTRSWGSWFFGCGLGVPIVVLITMICSRAYLEEHRISSWDRDAQTVVLHSGPRWWSWSLFLVVIVGIAALNAAGNGY